MQARAPSPPRQAIPAASKRGSVEFTLSVAAPITIERLIARLNQHLDDKTIVIADIGDALFAATELVTRERTDFISPAYYTSMGFSVPAALGAQVARPSERVLVLCGDGAFQMTGMELSTIVRHGFSPIIIVLDNLGYGTERMLHAGDWKYNEIHPWNYGELLKVYGRGKSYLVKTESTYQQALEEAWNDPNQPHLIQAKLIENDASDTLKKMAARMSEQVG